MRRIPLVAVALLALTGCAATTDVPNEATSAPAMSDAERDRAVCDDYGLDGGDILGRSADVLSRLAADPTGSTIDEVALSTLNADMSAAEETATPALLPLVERHNAPVQAVYAIVFKGARDTTIDTSTFQADSLAIMQYCADV